MDATERPRPHADVTVSELDDELVVYQPHDGQGYVLNATAAEIWQLCDGSHDLSDMSQVLAERYGLDWERALTDVQRCLESLWHSGLLTT